jgi:hypothetical protein
MVLPATSERVAENTCDAVNQRIRQQTDARVAWLVGAGPAAVDHRLRQLEEEWDIERCLETMAPTLTLAGIALGAGVSRKWLALPIVVQSFFLQHALQGWCPPIPLLRRLGVRTAEEIAEERYALKAIRGDFDSAAESIGNGRGVRDLMTAVRK